MEFDLAAVPAWAWVAAAAAVWYPLVGWLLRRSGASGEEPDVALWLLSPAVVVLAPAFVLAMAIVYGGSVVLWPLSGGLVRPFWKWQ